MNGLIISAPAKINLMLDVTGRRPDGCHSIITIMQSVSLCDRVAVDKREKGITVQCSGSAEENIPTDKRNTAYRAAEEFLNYTGAAGGAEITINKKIPSEAGLGGGSADAAAVIVGMNMLFGTNLPDTALREIGAKVGADVPFCIAGGTALCRGTGDEMSPAPAPEDCAIVIAKGSEGISTKAAYEKIDSLDHVPDSSAQWYDGTLRSLAEHGNNVFEQVCGCPDVFRIKELLLSGGAAYSAMTGSGSAVFGLFVNKEQAGYCSLVLRSKGFRCKTCKPIDHGPVIVQNH